MPAEDSQGLDSFVAHTKPPLRRALAVAAAVILAAGVATWAATRDNGTKVITNVPSTTTTINSIVGATTVEAIEINQLQNEPIRLAPGQVFSIERRIDPPAWFSNVSGDTYEAEAWLRVPAENPVEFATTAEMGTMTVTADGVVRLIGTVPDRLARRGPKFAVAEVVPLTAGDYELTGGSDELTFMVTITADGATGPLPVDSPVDAENDQRLLRGDGIADTRFGMNDQTAETALRQRFGEPTEVTQWADSCVGQTRRIRWTSLLVEFAREAEGDAGSFQSYLYGPGIDTVQSGASPPAHAAVVTALASNSGIVNGMTASTLRGIDERGEFLTGYDSFVANRWRVPGTEIVALLDRDFLDLDAQVIVISAPSTTLLQVC